MRKFGLFSLALLSLAAMNSCSEKLDETPAAPSQESFRTINVRASFESGEESTKTIWKDGEGLHWSKSDGSLFGLIDNKGTNKLVESFSINSDGTASFAGTVAPDAAHFFTYYPKVEAADCKEGDLTINFPIAAVQTQQTAGTVDLSSGKLALVGKAPVKLGESTEYSAAMDLQSSLARFIIYSAKGSSDKVKSVTLSASGNVNINGLWVVVRKWAGDGYSSIAGDQKSKTTVNLDTPYDLSGVTSQETASGIYMGLCPAILASGYVCEVVTDKGKYTFETSSSKEFKAGAIHNIALNLDKGQFESTPSHPFNLNECPDVAMIGPASPGGWDMNRIVNLTKNGSNWIWTGHLNVGEIQFLCDRGTNQWGTFRLVPDRAGETVFPGDEAKRFEYMPSAEDWKWYIGVAGEYNLTIDSQAQTVNFHLTESDASKASHPSLGLIGSAAPQGWDPKDYSKSTLVKKGDSHIYEWEGHLKEGNLNIFCDISKTDWSSPRLTAWNDGTEVESGKAYHARYKENDNRWLIKVAGTYKVTVDLSTMTVVYNLVKAD